ncbi:MAG: hypothetical protein IJL88_15800 [Clostridia bacterium]|nr:hypothetical protein [Clostridia bacterium]
MYSCRSCAAFCCSSSFPACLADCTFGHLRGFDERRDGAIWYFEDCFENVQFSGSVTVQMPGMDDLIENILPR